MGRVATPVCLRARMRLAYAGSRRSRIARRVCPLAAVNATLERATRTCVVGISATCWATCKGRGAVETQKVGARACVCGRSAK